MANHQLGTIAIPPGCMWTDEFEWSPLETAKEYGLTGALIVDVAERQNGRPITLEASDEKGWLGMTRAKLKSLYALAAVPNATYPLILADGREFTVMFRPGEAPISARPLANRENPPDDWPYIITLRLIEV